MLCCFLKTPRCKENFDMIRDISIANMSSDNSIFHTKNHVQQVVVHFATKALKCFDILEPDATWLYNRSQFESVILCSAYMHDIYHPANGKSHIDKEMIVKIASECLTGDIVNHIEDTNSVNLEVLHAIIGVHHTPDSFQFNSNQKQFMMHMIMATELDSYSDIKIMNVISPTLQDIGKTIMRCSDLSHFTMPWKEHLLWVQRLCNEMEFEMNVCGQIDFIDKFVLPQFNILHCFARSKDTLKWLSCIMENKKVWKSML